MKKNKTMEILLMNVIASRSNIFEVFDLFLEIDIFVFEARSAFEKTPFSFFL